MQESVVNVCSIGETVANEEVHRSNNGLSFCDMFCEVLMFKVRKKCWFLESLFCITPRKVREVAGGGVGNAIIYYSQENSAS